MYLFGVVFVEVYVDVDLGVVCFLCIVGSYGVGWLFNVKMGCSQFMGGIVWGMGMVLFEESLFDMCYGCIVNNNLVEYYVFVNVDVFDIDIFVFDEVDLYINLLGVKGIGEIGIMGVLVVIVNVVYYVIGWCVCELLIMFDKFI